MSNLNISIAGATAVEGLATNKAYFTISISEPLNSPLTLKYSTFNGTQLLVVKIILLLLLLLQLLLTLEKQFKSLV
ncbi:MAG: hypothetical protein Kow0049_27650 [Stanieria sp.]